MATPEKSPHPAHGAIETARWFGRLPQIDFEIEFFEEVLERNPRYVGVLRCLGELLARKGLHRRSLEIDRRLVALVPEDCVAHYNLACSLAMAGSHPQAIEELRRAIEHGYRDFQHLEVDPDLDGLRGDPAYQALLEQHGRGL